MGEAEPAHNLARAWARDGSFTNSGRVVIATNFSRSGGESEENRRGLKSAAENDGPRGVGGSAANIPQHTHMRARV